MLRCCGKDTFMNSRLIFFVFFVLITGVSSVFAYQKNEVTVIGPIFHDQDLFITKLQKSYSNYYFINESDGGFSDEDMYLYLKRYCKTINPKFISFSEISCFIKGSKRP